MEFQTITSKQDIKPTDKCDTYLLQTSEKNARSIIASLQQKNFKGKIILQGGDDNFNRRAIETLKIDYLVSPEKFTQKDTLKQRDSGLNHVTAKQASKNNISILIDFQDIQQIKDKKQKALRLAKIIQNIKICRRGKCKIAIIPKTKETEALGFSLGMSSQQVSSF